ncbi:hypothetical protein DXV76_10320 [Rhodobacteraceae bacterium CCMM004]|nr:hypothetical protein DXV76_10320 [Rhodobacteraceae bacterium CCMM004]
MTGAGDAPPRKAAQEVEIDRLLAEEFACDPGFAARFCAAAGLDLPGFAVETVTPEPSLGGAGYGDLMVAGRAGGRDVVLLIEDKISAAPATRQAARYAAHAARLRAGGARVSTVLVAPAGYGGERARYDAAVDLETVAGLIHADNPARQAWRRGIVARALERRRATGIQVPDPAMHALRTAYLAYARAWCADRGVALTFPQLNESYYDGDSWIEPVRAPGWPPERRLRHRLWTTQAARAGQVDLIVSPAEPHRRARVTAAAEPDMIIDGFSRGRGVQASLRVPEMRQAAGFDREAAEAALAAMARLADWAEARL